MTLKNLLNKIDYTLIKGNLDIEISDLIYDSRKVTAGTAFVCLVGYNTDGHQYIESAIEKGASAIVVSKDVEIDSDVTVVRLMTQEKLLLL